MRKLELWAVCTLIAHNMNFDVCWNVTGECGAWNEVHLYKEGIVIIGHGRAQALRLIPYSTLEQQTKPRSVNIESTFLDKEGHEH